MVGVPGLLSSELTDIMGTEVGGGNVYDVTSQRWS